MIAELLDMDDPYAQSLSLVADTKTEVFPLLDDYVTKGGQARKDLLETGNCMDGYNFFLLASPDSIYRYYNHTCNLYKISALPP